MSGPRATAVFLLATALIFATLLLTLSFRAASGLATPVAVLAVIVAAGVVVLAGILSRGVGEGRL